MTTKFIAYTRVSTQRQGSTGVSLAEQQRAISSYAEQHNLTICRWYEERQTAAKKGRPVFDQVMAQLGSQPGTLGLLLHKVDRGARNLRDWASIGEAIDLGVDVRFAHDDFDLTTRGGRLAADIQAVIAADYIRNLREEVRKGIEGRLNQGLYPMRAPRGYRDCGGGKVKLPDPIIAPLIISTFERYATGRYTYRDLADELAIQGLVSKDGTPLRSEAISRILRNPFYVGEIRVAGRQYRGIHQPLVTSELFQAVQRRLKRHSRPKRGRHAFRFRGALTCNTCDHALTGELQKKRVYYRCHRKCRVSVREDRVERTSPLYRVAEHPALTAFAKFESR